MNSKPRIHYRAEVLARFPKAVLERVIDHSVATGPIWQVHRESNGDLLDWSARSTTHAWEQAYQQCKTMPLVQPVQPLKRGFAAIDPERVRQISSQGGKKAHAVGNAHQWTSGEAAAAAKLASVRRKVNNAAAVV